MRQARQVVAMAALVTMLASSSACGSDHRGSGENGSRDKANSAAEHTARTTTKTPGSVSGPTGASAPTSTGAASCPPPTTLPHRAATTAAPVPDRWPPPGYDRSRLVAADVLAATATAVTLRWPSASGTTCTATLTVTEAWVLDANGYRSIPARDLPAFVASRRRDLGATHDGVPFLVEVSRDGRSATQLGEVPPG